MDNRVITLSGLLADLINGENPADVKAELSERLKMIDLKELAEAEDLLIERGYDIGSIQRANDLHTDLVSDSLSDKNIPVDLTKIPGHPACVFSGENLGISSFIHTVLKPD